GLPRKIERPSFRPDRVGARRAPPHRSHPAHVPLLRPSHLLAASPSLTLPRRRRPFSLAYGPAHPHRSPCSHRYPRIGIGGVCVHECAFAVVCVSLTLGVAY